MGTDQVPQDILQRVSDWLSSAEESIGGCLACGAVIHTEHDLIPDTDFHLCGSVLLVVYARIFDLSGDTTKTALGYGLQLQRRGWLSLVERLCSRLIHSERQGFQITGLKSKFGTLRISYVNGNEHICSLIEDAKDEATRTCERCGALGEPEFSPRAGARLCADCCNA